MSALVPYNHHGRFSNKYLEAHKRYNAQSLFIPRPFPGQSYNQWPFHSNNRYPFLDQRSFSSATSANSLMPFNQFNEQDKYAQYIRHLNKMQMNSPNRESRTMMASTTYTSGSWYNTMDPFYVYEKETRYLPYPVFGGSGLGFGRNAGRGFTGGLTTLIAPMGGTMDLPPKIRVIFIPTGASLFQQPCSGALGMPPFFFNRTAQPLCALPLPPPLPQIGSLPVTPVVQQMIMQQYSKPIAVLPFGSNLQIPPAIMSNYQSSPQQLGAPLSVLETPQYHPQSYIPPTLLPSNMPLRPDILPSVPRSYDTIPLPVPQANNGYSNICRACIPPPPSLNIPVTGHNWLQHCPACRHIPADTRSPNIRPLSGRSTPLLRYPIVQDRAYCPPIQEKYQYPYINPSSTTRPWLHNIPLPPGAVIISEEYFDRNNIGNVRYLSQNYAIQNPRVFHSSPSSMGLIGIKMNQIPKKKKRSHKKQRKEHKDKRSTSKTRSTNSISSNTVINHPSSSSSSCSLCKSTKRKKPLPLDIISNKDQSNSTNKQIPILNEVQSLDYEHQTPDLNSVDNNNQHSKIITTNSIATFYPKLLSNNFNITKNNNDALSTPISVDLTKTEDQKSISSLSLNQSQSQNSTKHIIIIQRPRSSSLCSIHTVSSDDSFTVTHTKEEKPNQEQEHQ